MNTEYNEIEDLLIGYLSGDLSEEKKNIVDKWRLESAENEKIFNEMKYGWNAVPLLHEMEQFNSFEALKKIQQKLDNKTGIKWMVVLQRAAAILIIPLLVYAAYVTVNNASLRQLSEVKPILQTITSKQGMVSQIILADGTKVWLNSGSTLQFPLKFDGRKREVKLTGEGYFEVARNEKQPFHLNTQELNVEVLGTSFNVVSYNDETISEVVLVTGKVKLSAEANNKTKELGFMHPGQRTVYSRNNKQVFTEDVNVDKYTAWRNGELMFRDDSMDEVVKRLSRWFNVEIIVTDSEINDYVYTATFTDESLMQVLSFLKFSAPINYRIEDRKAMPNGGFTKQKVYLMKKNK